MQSGMNLNRLTFVHICPKVEIVFIEQLLSKLKATNQLPLLNMHNFVFNVNIPTAIAHLQ